MGEPNEYVKRMSNSRQLLVHFDKNICSDELLYRTDKLNDIPVKVTPHRTLNYSRCVIWGKELAGMNEEDIQEELKSPGVTKVGRTKRRKDGRLIPVDSYTLTINGQEVPKEIKVGFIIRNTKVYIPNLQRCFNCQKYGHNMTYRPISLRICVCKTVERMVNRRLVWYLENNVLLAKQLCDYRTNRSTVDHLILLETFIRDAFIQNQHLVAVFFDLQKAHDTTWKHGILKDLHDMGLRGNLPIFWKLFIR